VDPAAAELRTAIDAHLSAALDRAAGLVPDAELLIDELRRVVGAGGKRLRPAFCYWGHRAAGGSHGEPILRAAAGLELLHTFAIVHDDIMDRSSARRGVPTVHARHGTDVALLAGDLALVLADDELMNAGFSPDATARAFSAYSRMRQEVISGQFLELRVMHATEVTEEEARRVAVLKSGRYSVREPLLLGALLADDPDEKLVGGLARAGECLGEAFQLADDLLGTFGDATQTGKPVDADIRSGKRNVLYAKTVQLLDPDSRAQFTAGWGRGDDLSDADVARLRAFVEASGARAETEGMVRRLTEETVREIEALDVDTDTRRALLDLAARSTGRSR
jgi:geranylgeranyl diphosphate synthase type I